MRLSNGTLAGTRVLSTLRLPAGGQRIMAKFANDGWGICGGDQYAPSIFDPSKNEWRPAVIAGVTVPIAQCQDTGGVWGVDVCLTDSTKMLMVCMGGIFTSADRGLTWTRRMTTSEDISAAQGRKLTLASRAVIDPINSQIMAVGLPSGLYTCTDGATFTKNTAIPAANPAIARGGIVSVIYDQHSTQTGGATQGLYVFSTGNGLYRMTGGVVGAATRILTDTTLSDMCVIPATGRLVICGSGTPEPSRSTIRYCDVGSTTFTSSNIKAFKLAAHPTLNTVYAVTDGGGYSASTDGAVTFTNEVVGARKADFSPWQEWTAEIYMTAGVLAYNPGRNSLWFGEGIGMWELPSPRTDGGAITWLAFSRGIEDMVGTYIDRHPTTGVIDFGIHDRIGFTYLANRPDWWPSRHVRGPNMAAIQHCNNISRAIDDPEWRVVMINNIPCVSTGPNEPFTGLGVTGYDNDVSRPVPDLPGRFTTGSNAAYPPQNGNLVAGNKGNAVLVPCNGKPMVFKNGAWSLCDFGTAANAALDYMDSGGDHVFCKGLFLAYYLHRVSLIADRANPGTFYLAWAHSSNENNATEATHAANTQGIWKSTDGGSTWTRVRTTPINGGGDYYRLHLKQVPGFPTHFFASFGDAGDPAKGLMFSKDGMATWTAVPGLPGFCGGVGFYRPLTTGSYPRIVVSGDSQGLRECLNFDPNNVAGANWTLINNEQYPGGMYGQITCVGDDMYGPYGSTLFTSGPSGGYMQRYSYRMAGV